MLEPSEQQEPGKSHSSDGRRSHNRPRSLWKKAPVMRYSSPASGKSPVKVTVVTPVGAATAEGVFEKNAPVMRCSYQGSGKSPVKVTEVTAVGAATARGAFEKSPCDEMLVPRRGESLGSDGAWSRHRRVSRARARAPAFYLAANQNRTRFTRLRRPFLYQYLSATPSRWLLVHQGCHTVDYQQRMNSNIKAAIAKYVNNIPKSPRTDYHSSLSVG